MNKFNSAGGDTDGMLVGSVGTDWRPTLHLEQDRGSDVVPLFGDSVSHLGDTFDPEVLSASYK